MVLRKVVISCIRTNICGCRSISLSSFRHSEGRKHLPSRKLFVDLTEKAYLDEKLSRSGRRPFEVMVEKPIVVKNFFVAAIDGEVVEYPNTIPKDLVDHWQKKSVQISEYFKASVKNNAADFDVDALKKLDVFGYNVPKVFAGQGYSNTYRTLVSENEAQNFAVAHALNAHRLVCFLISEHGTTEQYEKYLPKLAKGEQVGTIAFQEWNRGNQRELNTRAEYDDDDRQWCLNGKQCLLKYLLKRCKS